MKLFNFTFLVIILFLLVSCSQRYRGRLPESKRIFEGIYGYDDYDLGLRKAKKYDRPILLFFTAHCSPLPVKMYNMIQKDEIKEIVNNDLVFICLFVDERSSLPKRKQYYSNYSNDTVFTYGQKYSELQAKRFGMNAQPVFVLLTPDNEKLSLIGYTPGVKEFKSFLENTSK